MKLNDHSGFIELKKQVCSLILQLHEDYHSLTRNLRTKLFADDFQRMREITICHLHC